MLARHPRFLISCSKSGTDITHQNFKSSYSSPLLSSLFSPSEIKALADHLLAQRPQPRLPLFALGVLCRTRHLAVVQVDRILLALGFG